MATDPSKSDDEYGEDFEEVAEGEISRESFEVVEDRPPNLESKVVSKPAEAEAPKNVEVVEPKLEPKDGASNKPSEAGEAETSESKPRRAQEKGDPTEDFPSKQIVARLQSSPKQQPAPVAAHKPETITKILFEAFSRTGHGEVKRTESDASRSRFDAAIEAFEITASPKKMHKKAAEEAFERDTAEGVDFDGILAMARALSLELSKDALERSFRAALQGTILTERWLKAEASIVRKIRYKVKKLDGALRVLDKQSNGTILLADLRSAIEGLKSRLDFETFEVDGFMARAKLQSPASKSVQYGPLLTQMCAGVLPRSAVAAPTAARPPPATQAAGGRAAKAKAGKGSAVTSPGGSRVKLKPAEAIKIPVKEKELTGTLDLEQFRGWYSTLPIETRHRLSSTPLRYIVMRCPRAYQAKHATPDVGRRLEDTKKEEQQAAEEEKRLAKTLGEYPGVTVLFQAYSMLLDEWRISREKRTGFSVSSSKRIVRDNAVLNLEEAVKFAEDFNLIPELLSRSELADLFRRSLPKNGKGLGLTNFFGMIEKSAAEVQLPAENSKNFDMTPEQRMQSLLGDSYLAANNIPLLDQRLRRLLPRLVYERICASSTCMREVKQQEKEAEARRQSMRTERAGRLKSQFVRRQGWVRIMRLLQIGYNPTAPAVLGLEKMFRCFALRKEGKYRALHSDDIPTSDLAMTLLDLKQLFTDLKLMAPTSVPPEDAKREWLLSSTHLVNLFQMAEQSVLRPHAPHIAPPAPVPSPKPPSPGKRATHSNPPTPTPTKPADSPGKQGMPSPNGLAGPTGGAGSKSSSPGSSPESEKKRGRQGDKVEERSLKLLPFLELVHTMALHVYSQTDTLDQAYPEDGDKAAAMHRRLLADDHLALRDVLIHATVLSPLDPWPEESSLLEGHPEALANYKVNALQRASEIIAVLTDLSGEATLAEKVVQIKSETGVESVPSRTSSSAVRFGPGTILERLGSGSEAMKSIARTDKDTPALAPLDDPEQELLRSKQRLSAEEAALLASHPALAAVLEGAPHLLEPEILEDEEAQLLLSVTESDEDVGLLTFQERKARGCATVLEALRMEAQSLRDKMHQAKKGIPRPRWWELDTMEFTPELIKHNRLLAQLPTQRVGYEVLEMRSPQRDRIQRQRVKRRVGFAQRNGESWCAHAADASMHVPGSGVERRERFKIAPAINVEAVECGEEHTTPDGWVWIVRSCAGKKRWVRTAFVANVSIQTTAGWDVARLALPSRPNSPDGRTRSHDGRQPPHVRIQEPPEDDSA